MSYKRCIIGFIDWKNSSYLESEDVKLLREFICDVYDKSDDQFVDAVNRVIKSTRPIIEAHQKELS